MRQIPERDWKAWRKLSADALERFCDHILDEVGSFRTASGSGHSRYLELFRYLRERDLEARVRHVRGVSRGASG